MTNEGYFIYNGKFIHNNQAVISPDNRSFRYGDGFFESMLFNNSNCYFWQYHTERMEESIQLLCFETTPHFSTNQLFQQVNQLITKNKITDSARIRINFFRGNGGLYDAENNHLNYIIQASPIKSSFHLFKENGLHIDIYKDAAKSCDCFSNIKSNNGLCYIMAAIWAKQNRLNDAIVLNQYNRIADSTIANIFIVNKEGNILTPKLSEGCINGVIRRFILHHPAINVIESEITQTDLLAAKEIFLTNAIKGLMWVEYIENKKLTNNISRAVFNQLKLKAII